MKRLFVASCATSLVTGSLLASTAFAGHSAVITTTSDNAVTRAANEVGNAVGNAARDAANDVSNAVSDAVDTIAHYITPGQADFVASSLINANVKNNNNETIGEIKDLVIRNSTVEGVVIAVGGFLGLGQRYVVVDPSTMHMHVENGSWHVSTNATKESLKAAPEFKYEGRWAR